MLRRAQRRDPRRTSPSVLLGLVVLSALAACTDVGDSSVGGAGVDASATLDGTTGDATEVDGGDDVAASDSGAQDAGPQDTGASPRDSSELESGPAESGTEDTGAEGPPDTGAEGADSGPDATVVDSGPGDTGAPETGTPDATADAGAPEGGGGGGLAACTVAPCSANQVTCSNNAASTGGVCTPTEAAFVNLDIAARATTAAGDATTNPDSCYACLVANDCLDVGTHFTNRECEDFGAGTFMNATATVPAATTCDAVVTCITTSSCAASDSSFCYCGTGGGPSSQCATTAGGAAANGPCINQEVAGLPDAKTDTSDNVGTFFGTKADPSGRANDIFACATTNVCTQCL
jgi:hypothetical protein